MILPSDSGRREKSWMVLMICCPGMSCGCALPAKTSSTGRFGSLSRRASRAGSANSSAARLYVAKRREFIRCEEPCEAEHQGVGGVGGQGARYAVELRCSQAAAAILTQHARV